MTETLEKQIARLKKVNQRLHQKLATAESEAYVLGEKIDELEYELRKTREVDIIVDWIEIRHNRTHSGISRHAKTACVTLSRRPVTEIYRWRDG